MSIWRTAPVSVQANLTLQQWQIFEFTDGSRHLSGYCVENREGRASTAVKDIDLESMIAVTRSGRRYHLSGPPGFNGDAGYVWNAFKHVNQLSGDKAVSEDIYSQHLAAVAAAAAKA